ncbi:MAG TPA: signal peptidase II [Pseudogracilibacillus sp.]|nr:signal peptidase II [Pseudogracilibacillus sp.]
MYRYYIIALFVIIFDQWTKWLVVKNMELYERITLIDNFLYFTSFRNKGAAWGILQDQMMFFYIITIIVIVGIIYYLHKYVKDNLFQGIAIAFVLGGAIGNFIDRLLRKEVVDFIDVMIFNYDYPIFNLADSFLVIGVILIFIATIIEESKGRKEHE